MKIFNYISLSILMVTLPYAYSMELTNKSLVANLLRGPEILPSLPTDMKNLLAQHMLMEDPDDEITTIETRGFFNWVAKLFTIPLKGRTDAVSASYNPEGTLIVTDFWDNTAKIWDVNTGQCIHTFIGHNGGVNSARFNPAGTLIVTASWDNTARIWDAQSGKCIHTLTGHTDGVASASFNPAGTHIVTTSLDNTAKIWDVKTGKCIQTFTGHSETGRSASFNPAGTHIVTGSHDGTAKIWDVKTGKCIHTLAGHNSAVISASFNPAGTQIITTPYDGTAKIWNLNEMYKISLEQMILFFIIYQTELCNRLQNKRNLQSTLKCDLTLYPHLLKAYNELSENIQNKMAKYIILAKP